MQISGSGADARPSVIRSFLKADSAETLVRLQLQINVMMMGRADFSDIQVVDGVWYAWFLVDIDKYPQLMGGFDGTIASAGRQRTG